MGMRIWYLLSLAACQSVKIYSKIVPEGLNISEVGKLLTENVDQMLVIAGLGENGLELEDSTTFVSNEKTFKTFISSLNYSPFYGEEITEYTSAVILAPERMLNNFSGMIEADVNFLSSRIHCNDSQCIQYAFAERSEMSFDSDFSKLATVKALIAKLGSNSLLANEVLAFAQLAVFGKYKLVLGYFLGLNEVEQGTEKYTAGVDLLKELIAYISSIPVTFVNF